MNYEDQKFIKLDARGRELFKTILQQCRVTNYRESTDPYDHIDIRYTNNKGEYVGVEIKVRSEDIEALPSYIMDWTKYDALKDCLKAEGLDRILFVNFFGENTVYLFPFEEIVKGVNDDRIEIKQIPANKTTVIDSGKVRKFEVFVPKELGQKLVRKNDNWVLKR